MSYVEKDLAGGIYAVFAKMAYKRTLEETADFSEALIREKGQVLNREFVNNQDT